MMTLFPVKTGPLTQAHFSQRFEMSNHEGTDIFAPLGAEVQAVADGRVRHAVESKGGNVIYLVEPDGSQYYYAHLDGWVDKMPPNETREVSAGDVIGYVGATGNAMGKTPHIHFEVRPQGGAKVDPFPLLTSVRGGTLTRVSRPVSTARPARAPTSQGGAQKSSMRAGSGIGLLVLGWLFLRAVGR